ncbi:hypothetical protein BDW02DRAFT_169691 [Decorospora gaudefroyi]|uniref:AMP-activated protein kinase glycogen-binding domain-containing protein n=1 Tax=Decorospora gaudefroyi TaxID=184978 RepID=A0A6A5K7N5_9PLEO|nr:hypothetical protein BDW02DRAFT_169691 [Decorospora gaudefroyi]
MGKYTFTWEHSADDVYVTGTFDDWRKTVQLDKEDGIFKKTVELPKTHTQYKFVVNGNWCTNDSARKEDDGHGIINNVLLPEDIIDEPVHTMSSAAPTSTTAALAGQVPKENETSKSSSPVPGAFPETPYAETPGSEPQTFNVAPIPATSGLGNPVQLAPGEPVPDASTLTDNTIASTVNHDKDQEQEPSSFGVAPLPATAGAGNPIQLAPGEKVPDPSTFTSNTVQSTAKTDAASYENSDALPPLSFTPQAEREANGGMFGLPPVMGNMIPESSLPMGVDAKTEQDTGYTVQSAAPTSSTAQLAAQVPLEPRGVPETVNESQKEAHVEPEASANSDAVQDKKEMEQELKETVSEAPAAADNSYTSAASEKAGAAGATAAATATAGAGLFAGAIYAAKDKAAEASGMNGPSTTTADEVPSVVAESQNAAHASPEAAASPEVVAEKSAMEQELLSEIPKTNETGMSAPAIAIPAVVSESQKEAHVDPEAAASPEVVAEKKAMESELLGEIHKSNEAGEPAPALSETVSRDVPDVVAESQHEAHASPEAAANSEAVAEKSAVESELLGKLPRTDEGGEPAPVLSAATTATAPGALAEPVSRDVPDVVAQSQQEAHISPEAATNSEAVAEKRAMESELLSEVKSTEAGGEPASGTATTGNHDAVDLSSEALGDSKPLKSSSEPHALNILNAPGSGSAQPSTAKPIESSTAVASAKQESTTTEQSQPAVTTGVETSKTEATSSAPSAPSASTPETPRKDVRKDSDISPKGTPGNQSIASGADDKKKKRRSIFGKIKDKLSSKDKH